MATIDDLIAANTRLQQSTSAARATKDFATATAKWAQSVEGRLPQLPPAPALFFDGDPNRTGDLTPWDYWNAGAGDVPVSQNPAGGITPGVVEVAADPLGQRGVVYALTVTKDAHASPAQGTQSVYLWNTIKDYLGKPGTDTWVSFGMLFADYRPEPPTQGGITWLCEFHNGGPTPGPDSSNVFGIVTDHRLPDGTIQPQLVARFQGSYVFTNQPVARAWVDFLFGVKWSTGADGSRFWKLSGGQDFWYGAPGQTLWAGDRPNFELVNYRPSMTAPSTVYFSRVRIGATREAVTT